MAKAKQEPKLQREVHTNTVADVRDALADSKCVKEIFDAIRAGDWDPTFPKILKGSAPFAVDELVAALGGEDWQAIVAAANALTGTKWNAPKDEIGARFWLVRRNVRRLVAIGLPAVPTLIWALSLDSATWVKSAAEALGMIGCTDAVNPLAQLLGDEGVNFYWTHKQIFIVQKTAAEALGMIGSTDAVDPLAQLLEGLHYNCDWTDEEKVIIQNTTITALVRIGDERAVRVWLKYWDDLGIARWWQRQIVRALEEIGGPTAINALARLISSRKGFPIPEVAGALARLGDKRGVKHFVYLASNGYLNHERLEALVGLHEYEALNVLLIVLKQYQGDRLQRAIMLLADPEQDPDALDAIVGKELVDFAFRGHRGAALALRKYGTSEWSRGLCADHSDFWRLAHCHEESGFRVLADAVANVTYGDSAKRALAEVQDAHAIVPLIDSLGHKDAVVREAVALALPQVAGHAALDPLVAVLQDSVPTVRLAAVVALSRIGDRAAAEPVARLLKDGDGPVRNAAAETLGVLGDTRSVDDLVSVLRSEADEGLKNRAASALGRIGDLRAIPALVDALDMGLAEAGKVLGGFDGDSVGPLCYAICTGTASERVVAAKKLGERPEPMAVKYLSRALSKEGKEWRLVREEAVKALAEIARVSPILIAMTWRQLQEDARHQDQTENYWYQGRYDDSAELCTRHTDSGTYVGLPDFPQGLDL